MNKKTICSLVLALILSLSASLPIMAEKETKNTENEKTETVVNKSKSEKEDKKDEDKDDDEIPFPDLHTDYYMLADLETGKVLASENVDEKVYPASTTKILTAIIAIENCNLKDTVTATREAIDPIGLNHSNMGILVGEELTVEDLLYGLLVHSANDAANVLGVHISGNLEDFSTLMNEKAQELGMTNTNFVNAHGYHDDDHYTTVGDLAKVTIYAMKNELFQEIVKTPRYEIPPTNKYKETRYLSNTNMFISGNKTQKHLYKNCIGVKTGSTDEAGNCLISAAEENGTKLFAVVMKCKNDGLGDGAYSTTDSKALFEWGFKNFAYKEIPSPDDLNVIASLEVKEAKGNIPASLIAKDSLGVLLPISVKDGDIKRTVKLTEEKVYAPVKKGTVLGSVTYTLDGEVLGTLPLVSVNNIERNWVLHIFKKIMIAIPIILGIFLVIGYFLVLTKKRRLKKRRERRKNLNHLYKDQNKRR